MDSAPDAQMEIGHVLFMDIVGYSKMLIDEQKELQQQLTRIVRSTEQFRVAEAARCLRAGVALQAGLRIGAGQSQIRARKTKDLGKIDKLFLGRG
jgi:hypothetical protein